MIHIWLDDGGVLAKRSHPTSSLMNYPASTLLTSGRMKDAMIISVDFHLFMTVAMHGVRDEIRLSAV